MQSKNDFFEEETDNHLKNISKNLNYLMSLKNIDTQSISDRTGVGIATINNLKKGHGNPTIMTLSSIADFLQVSIGDLTDNNILEESSSHGKVKSLPLIRYDEIDGYLAKTFFATKTYSTEVDNLQDDSLFSIEISNNALSPEFERGTICIVSTNENVCDGDIVLVKIKEYPICFRRVFVGANGFQFCNISLESEMNITECTDYAIIGVLLNKINRLK